MALSTGGEYNGENTTAPRGSVPGKSKAERLACHALGFVLLLQSKRGLWEHFKVLCAFPNALLNKWKRGETKKAKETKSSSVMCNPRHSLTLTTRRMVFGSVWKTAEGK